MTSPGSPDLPSGTTIKLLLVGCTCQAEYLTSHRSLLTKVLEEVRVCEMTPLEAVGHDFPGAGHSICLILAESHLAIHTYPERSATAIVELSVCDHQRDNRDRAKRLAHRLVHIFAPGRHELDQSRW
jgi:spermidine synthase